MRLKICVAVLLLSVLSVLAIGHVVRGADTGTGTREATPSISLVQASVTVPRPQAPVVVEGALSANTRGWSSASGTVADASATGLPAELVDAYTLAVAASPGACHLSVSLLAAIGQVESRNLAGRSIDASHRVVPAILGPVLDGHGYQPIKDTDAGTWDHNVVWDRALGPLQFLPASWRVVGLDLDGDGLRDPQNVYDAAGAAMVYLCAGGRDLGTTDGLREAVLAYNNSVGYLEQVLAWKTVFDAADLTGVVWEPAMGLWALPEVTAAPFPAADIASRTSSQPTSARPIAPASAMPTDVPTAVPTAASLGSAALPSASPSPGQSTATTRPSSSAPSPSAPSSSAAPQSSATPLPSAVPSPSATADPTCPTPSPSATPTEAEPAPPTPSATLGPDGCPTSSPSVEPSASPSAP